MEASEEDRLPDEEVLVYARFRKYYRTLLMPTLHYLCRAYIYPLLSARSLI